MSEKITLQKIFDLAWQAFIIEDRPPAYGRIAEDDPAQGCLYDDGKGNKCAVGLALPTNGECNKYIGSFGHLVEEHPELFDHSVLQVSFNALNSFQKRLHDNFVCRWGPDKGTWLFNKEERMEFYLKVAEDYKLTIPAARPASVTA